MGHDGSIRPREAFTVKRLFVLLSALALFGAFAFGSTIVRADDQGENDNAQCQSNSQGENEPGDTRVAIAASDRDGTEGDDNEQGTSGDDVISGRGGDDELEGDQGDDDLCGDAGDDDMKGGPGNDVMNGGAGNVEGQAGNDLLIGGKGHDVLRGGRGRDRIRARDGVRDRINCGAGDDTVRADRADVVASNCEHVSR
jgi:Ca2+-binding RTX toxin-like protein